MSSKRSPVWEYFTKCEKAEKATCLKCGTTLLCKGSTTSALVNHLRLRHDIVLNKSVDNRDNLEADSEQGASVPKRILKTDQIGMLSFVKKESLSSILARCAAGDGFSINSIIKSVAIKGYVTSRGYKMPDSRTTVMKLILSFYEEKKNELKLQLKELKDNSKRFSMIEDEWSDSRLNKYLGVSIFGSETHVLGLVPIKGSCDALKLIELVDQKLSEFDLNIDNDIVASTHDAASIMQRYGRNIQPVSQLCFNHGIHLAMLDVLYKQNEENVDDLEENNTDENEDEADGEFFFDDENIDENEIFLQSEDVTSGLPAFNTSIKEVLLHTRRIIKLFRKSGVKNNILQQYVAVQEGKEYRLILDCKTRWNSLIPMLERFLLLKNSVKSALEDLGQISISNDGITILENILQIMKPTEVAVNELSKESATLLTAEGVFKFLFGKLEENNDALAGKLLLSLKERMKQRRNKTLMTLIIYLHSGTIPKSNQHFDYVNKTQIIAFAVELICRLFSLADNDYQQNNEKNNINSNDLSESDTEEVNLDYELHLAISSITKAAIPEKNDVDNQLSKVKNEFKSFELTGQRGIILEKLYQSHLTIRPTSTTNERVFSGTSNFVTKIRSLLSFQAVNALVYLKYYFLKQNK